MSASIYWARDLHGETRVVTEDDHHHAMLNAALTAEREWLEGTAKARADAVSECIAAVEALTIDRAVWLLRHETLAVLREVQP